MCTTRFCRGSVASRPARLPRLLIYSLSSVIGLATASQAQTQFPNLGHMSLEDLMNIEVTTVARKEQRARDVAAAIFVITAEDIQRSGLTSVPDLLRLAPGVNVAQINANKWAVSVRGFNGLEANKLLVLVDGRSVYNRLFAGVLWDAEDLMVDDIDHIEVIRGPGAALWGANSVNGVINIVTKRAAETRGTMARLDSGTRGTQGAIRYGAARGDISYRFFTQWTHRAEFETGSGAGAGDSSHNVRSGARADWTSGQHAFTMQGDASIAESHDRWSNFNPDTSATQPFSADATSRRAGYALGRWKYSTARGASLEWQSFLDLGSLTGSFGTYNQAIADTSLQYHSRVGSRHDLVIGGTYRWASDKFAGGPGFTISPIDASEQSHLVAAFVNDELALGRRVVLTLGTQVQYDSEAGGGVQPTARAVWKLTPRQSLWGAASRALRTPSPMDRGVQIDLPPTPTPAGLPLFISILGNPDATSETFTDAEVGYRVEMGSRAFANVTGFVGWYGRLRNFERSEPSVVLTPAPGLLVRSVHNNRNQATTSGFEVNARWSPVPRWHLDGSYSAFRARVRASDGTRTNQDNNAPASQWLLRSSVMATSRLTVDGTVFYVGPLDALAIDGYTRADAAAVWRFTSRFAAGLTAQNLLDRAHLEYQGGALMVESTYVRRSVSARLRWTF